jgi:hypothetical protein
MALFVEPVAQVAADLTGSILIEPVILREIIRRTGALRRPPIRFDGESYWFRYRPGRALRVFRRASSDYVAAISRVYRRLSDAGTPYNIPQILSMDHVSTIQYVIQTSPRGPAFADVAPYLPPPTRLQAARAYVHAVSVLAGAAVPETDGNPRYGDLLPRTGSIRAEDWRTYLSRKLIARLRYIGENVRRAIADFGGLVTRTLDRIDLLSEPDTVSIVRTVPAGTDVYVDAHGTPTWIDGVGGRTIAGDHRLDLVCAALTVQNAFRLNRHQQAEIWDEIYACTGQCLESWAETYRLYLGLLNLEHYGQAPRVFQWALQSLELGTISPRSAWSSR